MTQMDGLLLRYMLVALNPKGSKDKILPNFDIAIWKHTQEFKVSTPLEAADEDQDSKLLTAKEVAEIAPEVKTPPPASRKPSKQVMPPGSSPPNELETLALRSHRFEAVPQVENVSLLVRRSVNNFSI